MTERILDWVPRFDPRSRDYPVRAAIRGSVRRRNKDWRTPAPLDQGYEGACVGFSATCEALSTPVAVDLARVAANVPREPNAFARYVYREAKKIDEWAGENYEGTSVLAGAKAMVNIGTLREYRWAFSIEDVIDSVLSKGPVMFGSDWLDNMDEPNADGVIDVSGRPVGGHAYLFTGYRVKPDALNGEEDALVFQNSWGPYWGKNGKALMRVSDAARLLDSWGEACVPTKRAYGRG